MNIEELSKISTYVNKGLMKLEFTEAMALITAIAYRRWQRDLCPQISIEDFGDKFKEALVKRHEREERGEYRDERNDH